MAKFVNMIKFENFCTLLKKKHKKFRHVGPVGWMIGCKMVLKIAKINTKWTCLFANVRCV